MVTVPLETTPLSPFSHLFPQTLIASPGVYLGAGIKAGKAGCW